MLLFVKEISIAFKKRLRMQSETIFLKKEIGTHNKGIHIMVLFRFETCSNGSVMSGLKSKSRQVKSTVYNFTLIRLAIFSKLSAFWPFQHCLYGVSNMLEKLVCTRFFIFEHKFKSKCNRTFELLGILFARSFSRLNYN